MHITWLDFGGILLETLFCQIFFLDVFLQGKTLYWIYLRNGWIDVKWKGGASVGYWVDYVTLTFDLTHDLDLVFKVKVSNSLIWGMGKLIDMERKGCESIIHDHDRDLWVIMVGWVDVLYSDWNDFRRCVVDISSLLMHTFMCHSASLHQVLCIPEHIFFSESDYIIMAFI